MAAAENYSLGGDRTIALRNAQLLFDYRFPGAAEPIDPVEGRRYRIAFDAISRRFAFAISRQPKINAE